MLFVVTVVQVLNLVVFILIHRVLLFRLLLLRHQIGVWKRSIKRPKLKKSDRLFWPHIARIWKQWRTELFIVKPETVIRWRKRKFREFWKRKSQGKIGRPSIPQKHIAFIQRISSDHPEYGEDRIALELELKFGILHSTATIRKYRTRGKFRPRDSQNWKTFLKNQAEAIWSCDFFVQHTLGFRVLYIFVLMEIGSRKVIHFNVSDHPTLDWIKQQVRAACGDIHPKFVIHDNDGKYGQLGHPITIEKNGETVSCRSSFDAWLFEIMNIRGIPTPYRAPNAEAHIERLIGTLRRECLDHMLIWNERHLRRVLGEFIRWHNQGRVHQGINQIPDPDPELTGPLPDDGRLLAIPILNGLHHDYRLVA